MVGPPSHSSATRFCFDSEPKRAYQEPLKLLPRRRDIEVAAAKPFRPLTGFITALPPAGRGLSWEMAALFQRCQRAVDRARQLCETAEQIVAVSTTTLGISVSDLTTASLPRCCGRVASVPAIATR
jgi:hypothetical protein